jgi:DNA polymerase-1
VLSSGAEFNLKFRDFVMAGPGHYFIGFDYAQIELRVIAGFSQEPAMLKAFNEGIDIHKMTGSLLFGVPMDDVTDDQRGVGKTQNFAVSFGQGVKGIADRLGISVEEAKIYFDKYFDTFASLKSWINKQTMEGVANGYTISKFGRKHPIWELESESSAIRGTGERLCVNAPVQGSAADLMKIAMVRAQRRLKEAGLADRVHLIMNIHDALVWEAELGVSPQTIIDIVHPEVCLDIEDWPRIEAEWEVGLRWGTMTKLSLDANNKIIVPTRNVSSDSTRELAMAG